tara:strand:- start:458 stop:754 length:297 start_codon:yes stop_codon:yes gene_type:complete
MHRDLVSEKVFFEDDRLVVKRTIDANGMIKDAEYTREVSPNAFGSDHKHIGNVDVVKVHEWLKEAGVEWHDTHAVQEVIKKKLISGEYSKLRNWAGNY